MLTVGPVQENCYLVARARAPIARSIVDPGEEAAAPAASDRGVGRHARRDPAHAHALRPRRRRRAGREGHRRARLVPRDRAPRARRHHEIRPVARLRPVRVLRGGPPRRAAASAELAGIDVRRALHARPQPGHVTYAIARARHALFSGDVLFQGSIGRTDLPGGDHARLLRSIASCSTPIPTRRPSTRATWASRRSAPSARRIPSCTRSPGSLPGGRSSRPRAGPTTCCPTTPPAARRSRTTARRILGAAGYRRIETPTFEATELFARGVGESTDIVQKEMYTFEDGGGRSLTLRPEGTAPVCAPTSSTACTSCRSP